MPQVPAGLCSFACTSALPEVCAAFSHLPSFWESSLHPTWSASLRPTHCFHNSLCLLVVPLDLPVILLLLAFFKSSHLCCFHSYPHSPSFTATQGTTHQLIADSLNAFQLLSSIPVWNSLYPWLLKHHSLLVLIGAPSLSSWFLLLCLLLSSVLRPVFSTYLSSVVQPSVASVKNSHILLLTLFSLFNAARSAEPSESPASLLRSLNQEVQDCHCLPLPPSSFCHSQTQACPSCFVCKAWVRNTNGASHTI